MSVREIEGVRVPFLRRSGRFKLSEFLANFDRKVMIVPHGPQVFGQFRGKSIRVTYGSILGSTRSYLALQFFRDFWEHVIR
ncbi:MAG: hypothetical protein WBY78_04840 [Terriglobales bacterium]